MNKILVALSVIFCKSLITRILPHLFKAESTKQPGPVKREVATRTIIVMINEKPDDFNMPEMNPSVPWPELIPILVDSIIKILNLLFGKAWLSNSNPPLEIPEHGPPQEPGPAPNPRS